MKDFFERLKEANRAATGGGVRGPSPATAAHEVDRLVAKSQFERGVEAGRNGTYSPVTTGIGRLLGKDPLTQPPDNHLGGRKVLPPVTIPRTPQQQAELDAFNRGFRIGEDSVPPGQRKKRWF